MHGPAKPLARVTLASILSLLAAWVEIAPGQCEQGWWSAFDAEEADTFGLSVAIDGEKIVVGAPRGNGIFIETGAVYVYRFQDGDWILEQKFFAGDGLNTDRFGTSVAIAGDHIAVGAPGVRDKGLKSGAIYTYRFDGTQWLMEQKLLAPDGKFGDELGDSVALSDEFVVGGAPLDDDHGTRSGGIYIFRFDGNSWQWSAKLTASDGSSNDYFGSSLDIDADLLVAGSPFDDDLGSGSGSAYVFRWDGTTWIEEQKLLASTGEAGDSYAESAAIDGTRIVIGAPDHGAVASRAGAIFVYAFDGAAWLEEQVILANDALPNEFLGASVSLSGDLLAAGGPGYSQLSGLVRSFAYDGETWTQDGLLQAGAPEPDDGYGASVAVDGALLAVGVPYDDELGLDSGSVYAYRDALWSNYGEGWPGTNGIPTLTLQDDPALGNPVTLELGNSAGIDTSAGLMIGFSEAEIETLLEGTVLLIPHTLLLLSLPETGLALPGDLPCDPTLFSLTLYLQALVVDAGASWGVAFTPGLRMTPGSF